MSCWWGAWAAMSIFVATCASLSSSLSDHISVSRPSGNDARCPCVPPARCPHPHYGSSALDVLLHGQVQPCRVHGLVRCCAQPRPSRFTNRPSRGRYNQSSRTNIRPPGEFRTRTKHSGAEQSPREQRPESPGVTESIWQPQQSGLRPIFVVSANTEHLSLPEFALATNTTHAGQNLSAEPSDFSVDPPRQTLPNSNYFSAPAQRNAEHSDASVKFEDVQDDTTWPSTQTPQLMFSKFPERDAIVLSSVESEATGNHYGSTDDPTLKATEVDASTADQILQTEVNNRPEPVQIGSEHVEKVQTHTGVHSESTSIELSKQGDSGAMARVFSTTTSLEASTSPNEDLVNDSTHTSTSQPSSSVQEHRMTPVSVATTSVERDLVYDSVHSPESQHAEADDVTTNDTIAKPHSDQEVVYALSADTIEFVTTKETLPISSLKRNFDIDDDDVQVSSTEPHDIVSEMEELELEQNTPPVTSEMFIPTTDKSNSSFSDPLFHNESKVAREEPVLDLKSSASQKTEVNIGNILTSHHTESRPTNTRIPPSQNYQGSFQEFIDGLESSRNSSTLNVPNNTEEELNYLPPGESENCKGNVCYSHEERKASNLGSSFDVKGLLFKVAEADPYSEAREVSSPITNHAFAADFADQEDDQEMILPVSIVYNNEYSPFLSHCVVSGKCKRWYGSRATDVEVFGQLKTCPAGQVRCLDGLSIDTWTPVENSIDEPLVIGDGSSEQSQEHSNAVLPAPTLSQHHVNNIGSIHKSPWDSQYPFRPEHQDFSVRVPPFFRRPFPDTTSIHKHPTYPVGFDGRLKLNGPVHPPIASTLVDPLAHVHEGHNIYHQFPPGFGAFFHPPSKLISNRPDNYSFDDYPSINPAPPPPNYSGPPSTLSMYRKYPQPAVVASEPFARFKLRSPAYTPYLPPPVKGFHVQESLSDVSFPYRAVRRPIRPGAKPLGYRHQPKIRQQAHQLPVVQQEGIHVGAPQVGQMGQQLQGHSSEPHTSMGHPIRNSHGSIGSFGSLNATPAPHVKDFSEYGTPKPESIRGFVMSSHRPVPVNAKRLKNPRSRFNNVAFHRAQRNRHRIGNAQRFRSKVNRV